MQTSSYTLQITGWPGVFQLTHSRWIFGSVCFQLPGWLKGQVLYYTSHTGTALSATRGVSVFLLLKLLVKVLEHVLANQKVFKNLVQETEQCNLLFLWDGGWIYNAVEQNKIIHRLLSLCSNSASFRAQLLFCLFVNLLKQYSFKPVSGIEIINLDLGKADSTVNCCQSQPVCSDQLLYLQRPGVQGIPSVKS